MGVTVCCYYLFFILSFCHRFCLLRYPLLQLYVLSNLFILFSLFGSGFVVQFFSIINHLIFSYSFFSRIIQNLFGRELIKREDRFLFDSCVGKQVCKVRGSYAV